MAIRQKHIFRREIPFDRLKVSKSVIKKLTTGNFEVTDVLEKGIIRKTVFYAENGGVKSSVVYANKSIKNPIFQIEYFKSGAIKSQFKNKALFNTVLGFFNDAKKDQFI